MNPTPADFVEVLLPRPFDGGFDYLVPEGVQLAPGDFVRVPFGRQSVQGVVWGPARGNVSPEKCKPVEHRYGAPPMPEKLRQFIIRLARYTLTPLGLALKLAMPHPDALDAPSQEKIYRLSEDASVEGLSPRRAALVAWLTVHPGARREDIEAAGFSADTLRTAVKVGIAAEAIQPTAATVDRYDFAPPPVLSDDQRQAAEHLCAMQGAGFGVLALDGVTGSGKTEVYFEAIERILRDERGGQILVLLPEIALTVQWLKRFEARFGAMPHLWHSSVSPARRRETWRAVASGAARLVVGARSALFLPFPHLATIVVDEEHEASFKQEDGVIYQARDMAVLRASIEAVPVVLSSATPSLETVHNMRQGRYDSAVLASRHGEGVLPEVTLIDMREERLDSGTWMSAPLRGAMAQALAQGHQTLLFLNRRGYAPLLLCRACGHRFQCGTCSAWMVVHQRPSRLQCHHCDARLPYPSECPACHAGAEKLAACGPGVDRLREEAQGTFPQARIAVMTSDDADVAATLEAMAQREVDIIIGTQMVAKGHHFPHLALVGVVDGDLGLTGGDLRAGERTYQLLHQVAGRAGREAVRGEVFIQTFQPEHPVMQALAHWDRNGFISEEMRQREMGSWPPFTRLAALLLDGPREAEVMAAARRLAQAAPQAAGIAVLGPTPAPLSRLKGQFRYRLLVKAPREAPLQSLLANWLAACPLPRSVRLKVDVDPYYFL